MTDRRLNLSERLQRFVGQMKSSTLLMVVGSLFLLDLVVLDPLPYIDEVILGILTLLIARWQNRRRESPKPPPRDVTPPADG